MDNSRKPMSQYEKQVLMANVKLVAKEKMLKRDIAILINYIKGNKTLKNDVKMIIAEYTRKEQNDQD